MPTTSSSHHIRDTPQAAGGEKRRILFIPVDAPIVYNRIDENLPFFVSQQSDARHGGAQSGPENPPRRRRPSSLMSRPTVARNLELFSAGRRAPGSPAAGNRLPCRTAARELGRRPGDPDPRPQRATAASHRDAFSQGVAGVDSRLRDRRRATDAYRRGNLANAFSHLDTHPCTHGHTHLHPHPRAG